MIGHDLPGPSSASATPGDDLLVRDTADPAAARASAASVRPAVRTFTVRQQLEALRMLDPSGAGPSAPDAFAMPVTMRDRVQPPKMIVTPSGEKVADTGPVRPNLRTDLKLTSILFFNEPTERQPAGAEARGAVAVIDGLACRVGDQVAGWVIQEITTTGVTLVEPGDWENYGGPRTLSLEVAEKPAQGRH